MKIKVNEFVKRQTVDSKYDHFDGTWEELEKLTLQNFDKAIPGYRDGVCLIPVPKDRFFTSVVTVSTETKLNAILEKRRDDEEAFISIITKGTKKPAKFVQIVLYRKDVLAENNENSTNADWEIVSVNANPIKNTPMHPITMARNFLNEIGGTKAEYSAKEFADAIWFWKDKVMVN